MSENVLQDYIGFTFNGVHSSELGIKRVSDGSRFNENLLPTIQDKTVQVPGGDGTYFFGSYYTQKQINVSIAFDGLTEQGLAKIKSVFGDKKIHDLIFDETPYKIYSAKVTGTATIKYIPFNEGAGRERIYKGEGTIQFTCYNPFARSRFKFLDQYVGFENKEEWAAASGMKKNGSNKGTNSVGEKYDEVFPYQDGAFVDYYGVTTWNPGDKPSDFIFFLKFNGEAISANRLYLYINKSRQSEFLQWSSIPKFDGDVYIGINSKLNLIEGYNSEKKKTGTIYNQYIIDGAFFQIPNSRDSDSGIWLVDGQGGIESGEIVYDYYYL